jgi:hypothetical protein
MTTQYTTILKLALPVQGELSGTWGDVVNNNITQMVEQAVAGKAVINTWTGNSHTLTTADGTTSESRCAILELTDSGTALTGAGTVVCPTNTKLYIVDNNTAEIITVQTAAGTGVAVPVGKTMLVYCDGTNVVEGVTHANSLSLGTSTVTADKILDEDNMASDSATAIATQQSIKAYVDSQVGTVDTLSEILANGNTTGANDIDVDSAQKVQFRDADIYLNSSVDGQLDIVADTEIQIAATTVDLNGNLDVSGTALVTGVLTTTAATVFNGGFASNADSTLGTDKKVQFRDSAIYINSSADGQLDIVADTEIQIAATTVDLNGDLDVSGTALVAGVLTTTAATVFNGGFASNADSTLGTDKKVQFRDAAIYLNSSVDGQLDIVADGEVQIDTALVDINGNLDVSGTTNISGSVSFTKNAIAGVAISTTSRASNTVTVTTSAVHGLTSGDLVNVNGVADTSFNGYFTVSVSSTTVFTYSQTGADGSSTGGTSTEVVYNLNASGTALNWMNGPLNIAANSGIDGLEITQSGAGNGLHVTGTTGLVGNTTLTGNLDVSGTTLVTGVLTTTAATVFNGGFASNADSTLGTDKKVQFRDSAIYINSSADGQLDLVADTEIQIAATTIDVNGTLAFDSLKGTGATTVTNILDEHNMASDSATAIATQQSIKAYVDSQVGSFDTLAEVLIQGNTTGSTDIAVDSAQKVQFRDADIYINSSADGQLDIVADTEIQIAATTVDLNGDLDVSGTTLVTGVLTTTAATVHTNGITMPDNAKAIFGAGSDLEIYHDASDSIINDNGTGSLKLQQGGSTKLEVTATGIDVTGTVTADGLTVGIGDYLILDGGSTGEVIRTPVAGTLTLESRGSVDIYGDSNNNGTATSGIFTVYRDSTYAGGTAKTTLNITDNGDISFYEDTGTTPKFVWDASAESLGIGATPNQILTLDKASGDVFARFDKSGAIKGLIGVADSAGAGSGNSVQGDMIVRGQTRLLLDTVGTTRVVIDASGNVGIGTSSPAQKLSLSGASGSARFSLERNNTNTTGGVGSIQWNALDGHAVAGIVAYGDGNDEGAHIAFNTTSAASSSDVYVSTTEAMRLDSSGNALFGRSTSTNPATDTAGNGGAMAWWENSNDGFLAVSRNNGASAAVVAVFNRTNGDGGILGFHKDGTTVGSIGTNTGGLYIADAGVGVRFDSDGTDDIIPCNATGAAANGTINLGSSGAKFNDLYLSGGALTSTVKFLANTTVSGSDATIFRPADNTMAFSTGGAERLRIDASGGIYGSSATGMTKFANNVANYVSVADDGTITLTGATAGAMFIHVYDQGLGDGAVFFATYRGIAVLVSESASNTHPFSASDTDGAYCVIKTSNSHTVTFKNRTGATRQMGFLLSGANVN